MRRTNVIRGYVKRMNILPTLHPTISNLLKRKLTCGQRLIANMENVVMNLATNSTGNEKITEAISPGKFKNFLGITPVKNSDGSSEDRPMRVSIEGNIGAGKSTCIQYFKKFSTVQAYEEPLEWWRNVDGDNLLELLYSDIDKWISVFQSYVQLTRLKIQTVKPDRPETTAVQMFERSVQSNRFCFLEQAYRKGSLNSADYAVLDQWYRWIRANVDISLDLIVYLRTTPDVVYDRMRKRNRPEESPVTLQYLVDLHESHEKWLMSNSERFNTTPVLVLDGNQPLEDMIKQYQHHEHKILGERTKRISESDTERVRKNLKLDL